MGRSYRSAAQKLEQFDSMTNSLKAPGPTLEEVALETDNRKLGQMVDRQLVEMEKNATDPSTKQMCKMLLLQKKMHEAGQVLELTAKVVEHGTSGVKTVLQTQA